MHERHHPGLIDGDGSVVYHQPGGQWLESEIVSAEKLRSSSTWKRVSA